MYFWVDLMSLCPKIDATCMMSLVLWYSVVPFQCLKVWKVILSNRGLPSFLAVRFRMASKIFLRLSFLSLKTRLFGRSSCPNMVRSFSEIGHSLALLPFSGLLIATIFRSRSTSSHSTCEASPILAPDSLRNWSSGACSRLDADISVSSSSSVGMKGIRSCGLYLGFSHSIFKKW